MENNQKYFDPKIFTEDFLSTVDNTVKATVLIDTSEMNSYDLRNYNNLVAQLRDYRRIKEIASCRFCTYLPTSIISEPYEKKVFKPNEFFGGHYPETIGIGYVNCHTSLFHCLGPDCASFDLETLSCRRR